MRRIVLIIFALLPLWLMAVDNVKVAEALLRLDRSLEERYSFNSRRQEYIDSLCGLYQADSTRHDLIMQIGEAYTGFNNDSALVYFRRGVDLPSPHDLPYRWKLASLMPWAGFSIRLCRPTTLSTRAKCPILF